MEQEKSFCLLKTSSTTPAASQEAAVITIDILEAKRLLDAEGYRFLDVRTTEEFNRGHPDVNNPLNIPYMIASPEGKVKNPKFLEQVTSACSKDDHLILACGSGGRSIKASTDLLDSNFKHIKNMGGGYSAWVKNELAIKKPEAKE